MIWNGPVDVGKSRDWVLANLWTAEPKLAPTLRARIENEPKSITAFVGKWGEVDALESYDIGAPFLGSFEGLLPTRVGRLRAEILGLRGVPLHIRLL